MNKIHHINLQVQYTTKSVGICNHTESVYYGQQVFRWQSFCETVTHYINAQYKHDNMVYNNWCCIIRLKNYSLFLKLRTKCWGPEEDIPVAEEKSPGGALVLSIHKTLLLMAYCSALQPQLMYIYTFSSFTIHIYAQFVNNTRC